MGNKKGFVTLIFLLTLPLFTLSCDYFFPPFSGEKITVEEAHSYISRNEGSENMVILDLRNSADFKGGHISGALNYDYDSTGFPAMIEKLDRSGLYIVYSNNDWKSYNTVELMLELGFKSPHAITGGVQEWINKGYPLKK